MDSASLLAPHFKRLEHGLRDFMNTAATDNVVGLLGRLVQELDKEPLRGFLTAALPPSDFQQWWLDQNGGRHFSSGKRAIDWPADTARRVALQVDAVRLIASKQLDVVNFAYNQFNAGRSFVDALRKMGAGMLAPMLRDLEELAAERPASTALTQSVRDRPRSNDPYLDALLEEACTAFLDPTPQAHRRALDRLWDAWERAKTVQNDDKKAGASLMLDSAAQSPGPFRELLEREAKELTDIGNQFHIRHHETTRTPLNVEGHVDYLFHRMLAMLHLVLRQEAVPPQAKPKG